MIKYLSAGIRYVGLLLGITILVLMMYTGVQAIASHIIGVYTDVPDKIVGFHRYVRHVAWMEKNIENWTWEEYKRQEKDRLRWEKDIMTVAAKMLKRLEDANQIGK